MRRHSEPRWRPASTGWPPTRIRTRLSPFGKWSCSTDCLPVLPSLPRNDGSSRAASRSVCDWATVRATRDLDLARQDTEDAATLDLTTAAEADLGDFFVFAIEPTDALDAVGEGVAVRYQIQAQLADRRFENVILDIGFDVPLPEFPDLLTGTNLLAFAGIEPITIAALPLEYHVAEKSMPTRASTAQDARTRVSRI